MNLSQLVSSFFNWIFGLVGMIALILGLSFMPTLFGHESPDHVFMMLGGVTLYKGILSFFSNTFAIGILVVSTALFVWVGLLFSMSFHTMVETLGIYFHQESEGGFVSAWVIVLATIFMMVAQFVYILFGMILTPTTLLVGALMILAMCALLFANYNEVSRV